MKRSGLSMAAMVATVVMVLTVSTYAITARAVNPRSWSIFPRNDCSLSCESVLLGVIAIIFRRH